MSLKDQISEIYDYYYNTNIYCIASKKLNKTLNKTLNNIYLKYFKNKQIKYESFTENIYFEKLISKLYHNKILSLDSYKTLYKYYETYMLETYLYIHDLKNFNTENLYMNVDLKYKLYLIQKYFNFDIYSKECLDYTFIIFFYLNFLKITQFIILDIDYVTKTDKYQISNIILNKEKIMKYFVSHNIFFEDILNKKIYYFNKYDYEIIKSLYFSDKMPVSGIYGIVNNFSGNNNYTSISPVSHNIDTDEGRSYHNRTTIFKNLNDTVINIIISYKIDLEFVEDIHSMNKFLFKQNIINYGLEIIDFIDENIIFNYLQANNVNVCIKNNNFLLKYNKYIKNWDYITNENINNKKIILTHLEDKKINKNIVLCNFLQTNNIEKYINLIDSELLTEMIKNNNKLLNYKPILKKIKQVCLKNLNNNYILLYAAYKKYISFCDIENESLSNKIIIIKTIMDFKKLTHAEILYIKKLIDTHRSLFYIFMQFNIHLFSTSTIDIHNNVNNHFANFFAANNNNANMNINIINLFNIPILNPIVPPNIIYNNNDIDTFSLSKLNYIRTNNNEISNDTIIYEIMMTYFYYKNNNFYESILRDKKIINFENILKKFFYLENNDVYINNLYEIFKLFNLNDMSIIIENMSNDNVNNIMDYTNIKMQLKDYKVYLSNKDIYYHMSYSFLKLLMSEKFKNYVIDKTKENCADLFSLIKKDYEYNRKNSWYN